MGCLIDKEDKAVSAQYDFLTDHDLYEPNYRGYKKKKKYILNSPNMSYFSDLDNNQLNKNNNFSPKKVVLNSPPVKSGNSLRKSLHNSQNSLRKPLHNSHNSRNSLRKSLRNSSCMTFRNSRNSIRNSFSKYNGKSYTKINSTGKKPKRRRIIKRNSNINLLFPENKTDYKKHKKKIFASPIKHNVTVRKIDDNSVRSFPTVTKCTEDTNLTNYTKIDLPLIPKKNILQKINGFRRF